MPKNRIIRVIALVLLIICLLVGAAIAAFAMQPDTEIDTVHPVGLADGSYVDESCSRLLAYYLWHPTSATENVTLHDDNADFADFLPFLMHRWSRSNIRL